MQVDGAAWVPRTDDPDAVYDAVTTWVEQQGLSLYPHQDEAIIELLGGSNVVLATPTGSGKSLVAMAAHAAALAGGRVSFYTAPIKALVSEKFFALCEIFGPENVGMLTGDASVNSEAPIICCTAEVLANIALREGPGRRRRPRGHGRVPLLLRARSRLGLAGPAARADPGPVRADVGDARRRQRAGRGPDPAHRPGDGRRRRRRTTGAADLLVGDDPPGRHPRRARREPPGPGVRRALHPGGGRRARHLTPHRPSRHRAHPRGPRGDQRAAGRFPVRRGLRQDPAQAGTPGHRGPPRRDAAALPPARGAAGPVRAARRHLRDRHPRCRHQRADPDGALHRAREVRRHPAADPALARVHADRRPRRSRRLRHRGVRRRTGSRARDRQRDRAGEGGRRSRRSSAASAARSHPTARSSGPRRPSTSWSRAPPNSWCRG